MTIHASQSIHAVFFVMELELLQTTFRGKWGIFPVRIFRPIIHGRERERKVTDMRCLKSSPRDAGLPSFISSLVVEYSGWHLISFAEDKLPQTLIWQLQCIFYHLACTTNFLSQSVRQTECSGFKSALIFVNIHAFHFNLLTKCWSQEVTEILESQFAWK